MDSSRLISDMNEIRKVLPGPVIHMVLKKGSETEPPDKPGYRDVHIIHNQSDWLWRSFMRFLMPFQLKTNRRGLRKMSLAGGIYTMSLLLLFLGCVFAELIKYPLYLAWAYVVVRSLLPAATAFARLWMNKRYYRSLYGKGE